jgi:Wzt C-terminal domain
MDAGQIAADGPTPEVIQTYLERERAKMQEAKHRDVQITSVTLGGAQGQQLRFGAGEPAWIDVAVVARRDCERVAVTLQVLDQSLGNVLHTSSERLGGAPLALRSGERCKITFQLAMHLAVGTYHIALSLYRYDIQREFDRVMPAATFFVDSDVDVRGVANLYPRVTACAVS